MIIIRAGVSAWIVLKTTKCWRDATPADLFGTAPKTRISPVKKDQAVISRQQVTNITRILDKEMKFTGEIGNCNVPLDQTISADRSICQAIVESDEDARRAMFTISQMLPSSTSTRMILNGTLSAKFSLVFAERFTTLPLSSNSRSSGQSTRGYGASLTVQILRTTMHCLDACSHADASPRRNCPLTAMALTCSYKIFCVDAPATLLALRTSRLSKVKRLACT
jgi:hypothetical protein